MKYTLFSDDRRLVNILMLIGGILLCVGVAMQVTSFIEKHSLWVMGIGCLLQIWGAFSYIFVKAKLSGYNPSKVIANISFLVLTAFWSLLFFWIFVNTQ